MMQKRPKPDDEKSKKWLCRLKKDVAFRFLFTLVRS